MRKISVLSLSVLALSVAVAGSGSAQAALVFEACATGAQEVPAPGVDTLGQAEVYVVFDDGMTKAKVTAKIKGLGATVTGAHLHCAGDGLNGPVVFGLVDPGACVLLAGNKIKCTLTNADWTGADCVPDIAQPVNNIASLHAAIEAGLIYLNVHTTTYPGGEIRGQLGSLNSSSCFGNDSDEDSD